MGDILRLGALLSCPPLLAYTDTAQLFDQRDEIKSILVHHLKHQPTQHWLFILEPADIWCADVLTWDRLFAHEAFQALNMIQPVLRPATPASVETPASPDIAMRTTRCPIRIDGELYLSSTPAPRIGEHNQTLEQEFNLPPK